jgi:hypothetical protein
MAAKHDMSKTSSSSSTVNNTTTSTQNISDSYNSTTSNVRTNENVGNTLVQFGLPGLDASSGLDAIFGAGTSAAAADSGFSPTILALLAGAAVLLFFFLKR